MSLNYVYVVFRIVLLQKHMAEVHGQIILMISIPSPVIRLPSRFVSHHAYSGICFP